MSIRLDIGCGIFKRPGYTGIDPYVNGPDIINASMDKLPFENNSVDEIYSSHALEHIGKWHVVPTLQEWYRVLSPNGFVDLQVPDLKWCVLNWLMKGEQNDWSLDTIFGNQEVHNGVDNYGEYHKTGFTEKLLRDYCTQAGFKINQLSVIESHSQPTLRAILIK